jgi:hypothetical protein
VDIAIPGNDDSMRSVETILSRVAAAIQAGARAGRPRGPVSGGSDDALADAMRVAGPSRSRGKKVLVRRRPGPAPTSPFPANPAAAGGTSVEEAEPEGGDAGGA